MFLKKALCAAALLSLSSLCFAALPVHWSVTDYAGKPLRDASAELNRTFDPGDEFPFQNARGDTYTLNTCAELLKADQKKQLPVGGENAVKIFISRLAYCYAYQEIAAAKPSKVSYLLSFALNKKTVEEFPALMASIVSGEEGEYAKKAGTLAQFARKYPLGVFREVSPVKAVFTKTRRGKKFWTTSYEVVARGDFNGDGIEDALVRFDDGAVKAADGSGSYGTTRLFLITRLQHNGAIVLLKQLIQASED
jgi:hypothetical protein